MAVVTSKFPSIAFMSAGAREVLKKRGLNEVLFLEWDFGNRDFGPIANRVKDAKPDFVWVGAIGLDGNLLLDAMKKIDYAPPQHFYMYPAPGPLVTLPEAKNALSVTIFEEQPPFTANPGGAEFVAALQASARPRPASPTPRSRRRPRRRTPPGRSSRPASSATKSLDDKKIGAWLKANRVDTIQGKLRFDGAGNFGDDLMRDQAGAERQVGRGLAEGDDAPAAPSCSPTEPPHAGFLAAERIAARAVRPVGHLRRRPLRPARAWASA